ncbi:MAG TPA: MBL fold metallo-hydrolase, partial [Roseiflexaceae bacterium]|nr:MBL fold metallo-hydrolase [Roseiflexaceae bacterium]
MSIGPATRYQNGDGARIYGIQARVFPPLIANIYVVIVNDYAALIDTGSGLGESDDHVRAGMEALRDEWGERLEWADLKRIVITHGHIDHYGGLGAVLDQTRAPVAVHELDRRVLIN